MNQVDNLPGHTCQCQSTEREIAVLFGKKEASLQDFAAIVQRFNGSYNRDLSLVVFPVSASRGFSSAGRMRDFFETHWGVEADALRCCWLEAGKPLDEQLANLVAAGPVSRFASDKDSPLRDILDNRRIDTHFQPIFRGPDLTLWGYECLARARDSAEKLVPPDDLFRWAREENLLFMLDRVCRESHILNAARADVPANAKLLINFLPTVIYDANVCLRSTIAAVKRTGLRPEQILFEVVESESITDREHLRSILDHYRASGFGVALDDVGSGHSGLALLGDLAPDLIKIDRHLVTQATTSSIHQSICRSIVDIGRSANKLVLAEGVETEEELALFAAMGVDLYQGFLLGRPDIRPAREPLIKPLVQRLC